MKSNKIGIIRWFIVVTILLCSTISAYAQFGSGNSAYIKAFLIYERADDGFYYKRTDVSFDDVYDIKKYYAYDKKTKTVYCMSNNANYAITLTKEKAKEIKKMKGLKHLEGNELDIAIEDANVVLINKYNELNQKMREFLEEEARKAREKALADSIAKAKQDSIDKAIHLAKIENYRNTHNWKNVPIGKYNYMDCELCDKRISEDTLLCVALKNDTLFTLNREKLSLGIMYPQVHKLPISKSVRENEDFKLHIEAFRDSLEMDDIHVSEYPEAFNFLCYNDALNQLKKKAPYGFFNEWGWDNEYSSITFNFEYTNLNRKTIKYINVFFVVTNDVGDVRKTGNFKGTGPLAEFESASWNWDHSSYYVAGDASNMSINKVVITYMDGTQKVLPKNMIQFD